MTPYRKNSSVPRGCQRSQPPPPQVAACSVRLRTHGERPERRIEHGADRTCRCSSRTVSKKVYLTPSNNSSPPSPSLFLNQSEVQMVISRNLGFFDIHLVLFKETTWSTYIRPHYRFSASGVGVSPQEGQTNIRKIWRTSVKMAHGPMVLAGQGAVAHSADPSHPVRLLRAIAVM